jgi:CRISPR/Cas system Type II protein with McrA/HNH and RuvC-like nuclease domain
MYPSNRHIRLHDSQDGKCYYCHEPMTLIMLAQNHPRMCTADHKIPHCRGGRGSSNFVGACSDCNLMKGNMTDVEFLQARSEAAGNRGRLIMLCKQRQMTEQQLGILPKAAALRPTATSRRRSHGVDTYQAWGLGRSKKDRLEEIRKICGFMPA